MYVYATQKLACTPTPTLTTTPLCLKSFSEFDSDVNIRNTKAGVRTPTRHPARPCQFPTWFTGYSLALDRCRHLFGRLYPQAGLLRG